MQNPIAPYLKTTDELLQRAFPDGMESETYLAVLAILEEELSNRNLAEVIAHFTGKDDAVVSNDIYRVSSIDRPSITTLTKVKEQLLAVGYDRWLEED
ncbi:hypothetical protein CKA32_001369 [Geitlerinema sp. FC II]|nr:hypothetical protein CKA32_001369 [Geitlerinema sp. FC II]